MRRLKKHKLPPVRRVKWAVLNTAGKLTELFDYIDRRKAVSKAEQLTAAGKPHYVAKVKL